MAARKQADGVEWVAKPPISSCGIGSCGVFETDVEDGIRQSSHLDLFTTNDSY